MEERETNHKNVKLVHSNYKGKMRFNAKTFVEKRIVFSHEGKCVYSYMTKNSQYETDYESKLEQKNTDMCDSIISINKIFRRESDKKIVMISIAQTDVKVFLPQLFLKSFMPKSMDSWAKSLDKFILKHRHELI